MSFWKELKRRNVYKVGVAYLIVAWLIVQAAAIVFPHLNLPTWAVTLVIVILIIGLPIALLLAWAYEVTPEGIKRTKEVPLAESITHLTGQKLNYIVTGLLVVAVAALVVDNYLLDKDAVEPEVVSTETKQAPTVSDVVKAKKTIAVLPFDNLSSDPEQEYFVLGLSEEILNSLAQIADLTVIAKTSSFSFKSTNKKVQEIANELGVENILEGSVRKAGDALRITAQLVKGVDGSHLWSKTYDRELKDIFEVQEDIAKAVTGELKVTLGIDQSRRKLGSTDNVEAYKLYLVTLGQLGNWEFKQALETIDASLSIDPKFALAWTAKATIHNSLSTLLPINNIISELENCHQAVQKAIEIEPNLAEAYTVLGDYKAVKGKWIEAELSYRKALELSSGPSLYIGNYSQYLSSVGYLKKNHEFVEERLRNDPLNPRSHTNYIASSAYLGDMKQAEKEYQRWKTLLGNEWIFGDAMISLVRLTSGNIVTKDEIVYSDLVHDIGKEYLNSPKKGLVELHRIYKDTNLTITNLWYISWWAAYFNDFDFALDATEKVVSFNAINICSLWYPVMHEVRQLPRFKEFAREIGLVDYWNEFGWPDICRPFDNGDFECD